MSADHPIVSHFRDIELLLKNNLNASGQGTRDLIESVSDALPETTKILIRQLVNIRNRHIHKGVTPRSIGWFVSACNGVKQDLQKISNGSWNMPGHRRLWAISPAELEEFYGIYLHDYHVFIEPRLYFYDEQSECYRYIDSLPRKPLNYRVSEAENNMFRLPATGLRHMNFRLLALTMIAVATLSACFNNNEENDVSTVVNPAGNSSEQDNTNETVDSIGLHAELHEDNLDDNVPAEVGSDLTSKDIVSAQWIEYSQHLSVTLKYNSNIISESNGAPYLNIFYGILLLDLDAKIDSGAVGYGSAMGLQIGEDTAVLGIEAYLVLSGTIGETKMFEFVSANLLSVPPEVRSVEVSIDTTELTFKLPHQLLESFGLEESIHYGLYIGNASGPTDLLYGIFQLTR